MDFLTQVARDIQQITTTDFATEITFKPPTGDPVTVGGYAGKHSMEIDVIGFAKVNSKLCNCDVSEQSLIDGGYTTRDANGDLLNLDGHLVTWTDVSGQTKTYIIQKGQSKSDESTGHIVFILGKYTPPTV